MTQMFLRTAQTEQRIADLEEKMAMVLTKLGMVPKDDDEPPKPKPKPEPDPEPEPDEPDEPAKLSRIAQKVAKGRR